MKDLIVNFLVVIFFMFFIIGFLSIPFGLLGYEFDSLSFWIGIVTVLISEILIIIWMEK